MKSVGWRGLIVLGVLLVLGTVNVAIVGKERTKRDGEIVYLPLAPVDPRSLVQGDYMALRFAMADEIERRNTVEKRLLRNGEVAFAWVKLDDRRIASLSDDPAVASIKFRYRIRNGHVWLGTNAFFFEEGTGERFRGATYGEFRVDRKSGEAVLVGLRSDTLTAL
ncbi:MAG: GDYXXLXY domain-containing protein [Aquabacterium sp.]|uniref:GDYXXLXY domain-containing protein n=1 Tax=Aquabacterium sp. TaxID=1872578 RepID=UPI0025C6489E|nr:GDYXXLXY domain-containing protein [Aquabacterium sp.]MBI3381179.1 GDYXXLXY domain-containing protein [Aquabacterium sp.]